MRTRYTMNDGRLVQDAEIYDINDHSIRNTLISLDARKIVRRLQRFGHEAYIVGGAVRDLLLGKTPKDFDIATSATPSKVRTLFRNSLIIGKRFKLVHVLFKGGYVEVATFRARESDSYKDRWGSIVEDAHRRDFSVNALYYSPDEEIIIDYVGGMRDLRRGILFPLIPCETIFEEDPVRILRAVKYSVMTGLKLPRKCRKILLASTSLLSSVSSGRLTEELFKIIRSGVSARIVKYLYDIRVFEHFLPELHRILSQNTKYIVQTVSLLQVFDERLKDMQEMDLMRSILPEGLAFLLAPSITCMVQDDPKDILETIKTLTIPTSPPGLVLRKVARKYLRLQRENL